MLDANVVADAILFALSVFWCRAMFGRWRRDLSEFRQATTRVDRAAIAVWWVVTVIPVWFIVSFVIRLGKAVTSW